MRYLDNFSLNEFDSLQDVEQLFYYLLEITSDFIYIKNREFQFVYASESLANLCGFKSWKDMVGKTDFEIFPSNHANIYFEEEKLVIEQKKEIISREEPYYKNNRLCYVSSSKRPILDKNGEVIGLFGISRDITKRKNIEKKLQELANYDSLTNLCNRRMFFEHSNKLLELVKRENKEAVLYFIDLDNFKDINDIYGHDFGDEVLKVVASRLGKIFRSMDIISRFGGDEFVVFNISKDDEKVKNAIKDNILNTISKDMIFNEKVLKVGCSIGYSSFPKDADNLEKLITFADNKMYKDKENKHIR